MITQFQKGSNHSVSYPCLIKDVSRHTGMVNPCDGKHHNVPPPFCVHSDEYREEAEALLRVALDVERGIWPAWYFDFCGIETELSPILKVYARIDESDPKACARLVHMDHPSEIWSALVQYSARAGIPIASNLKGVRFLERIMDPLQAYANLLVPRMHAAFEVKYYYGFPRPEEYFEAPTISSYPEGCPNHPSYIAGHGTYAGVANYAFKLVFPDATRRQLDDVKTATLQFAHLRDVAVVHSRQDSLQGWNFGNGLYD